MFFGIFGKIYRIIVEKSKQNSVCIDEKPKIEK
jgi:hypothetical protein